MQIDNNSPVPAGAGHEIHKNQNVQPHRPVEKPGVEKPADASDRVEISKEGQQLLETRFAASGEESDRLGKAVTFLSQTLLAAGVVDDLDKAVKIAERVVKKMDEGSGLNEERLQEIRDRLENDFYKSAQVLETIVERLQDDMNIG